MRNKQDIVATAQDEQCARTSRRCLRLQQGIVPDDDSERLVVQVRLSKHSASVCHAGSSIVLHEQLTESYIRYNRGLPYLILHAKLILHNSNTAVSRQHSELSIQSSPSMRHYACLVVVAPSAGDS